MQRKEASPGRGPTPAEEEEMVKGEICRERLGTVFGFFLVVLKSHL